MRTASSLFTAAVAAVAASLGVAIPANAAVTPGDYVAIGDSYASGVGAYPYNSDSGACKQSPNSYPRSWARNHPAFTLKDMTCSGATIADVENTQLGALGTATRLVTITVGGNDVGFTDSVTTCLTGSDDACGNAAYASAWRAQLVVPPKLRALYAQVKDRAPNARVVVLGYPRLVDPGTGSCGAITPSATKRQWLNYAADQTSDGIRSAAGDAGVTFVDVRPAFADHQACGTAPWINGVDLSHYSEIFHPNHDGHAGVYTYLLTIQTDLV
ncbi:SGNH/GDSL hydrolase family protein [Umezawaea tangerina]|uniref:GDSL-like lipase/acylhydrolase family protein n=1 Tax=Umezawaea tangerina TaxID=84725 RepID=A0A2T0T7A5_9PSEU|nr:SGNH/GDSL hydrolase family protein [Umezawaea tangerina]PRY41565.1 GDSL-like lipase/acylhydrolase family protein [Umezawaea tangerina]